MNTVKLSPAVLVLILLCSCSKYQYVYLGSHLQHDNDYNYFNSNDTFGIKYSFHGENCPITIEVHNKLNKPLFVDWNKSAIILDNQTLNLGEYVTPPLKPFPEEPLSKDSAALYTRLQVEYSGNNHETVSYIPPKSYISAYTLDLTSKFFDFLPQDSMVNVKLASYNGSVRVKRYFYNEATTPFRFSIYLTLSTHQTFNNPLVSNQSFWISDIIPTLSALTLSSGNQFVMSEETNTGKILGVTGGLAILTALVVLQDWSQPAGE